MKKLFKKVIDGVEVIKYRHQIVIDRGDYQTFNPTEEMLLEDGWEEYVIDNEPTNDPFTNTPLTLEYAKEKKLYDLASYDSSSNVNEFTYNGFPMWLDKATRAGLMLRVNAELLSEKFTTTLWYNNYSFTLDTEAVQKMLYALELYASECYDNTQMHAANIMRLETIEDVMNYNFTLGYPKKLSF